MTKLIRRTLFQTLSQASLILCAFSISQQVLAQETWCDNSLSQRIARSCVVKPEVLWRGAKPDAQGATALLELGVASVVNLELLNDDMPNFLAARPKLEQARSINYFRLREWEPNVVIAPAKLEQSIAQFIAIMRSQAKPVYVHCRSGQNRTGVMVAAYRIIEEGLEVNQAIREMGSFKGIWLKQNANFLRKLAAKPRQDLEQLITQEGQRLKTWQKIICDNQACQLQQAQ